MNDHLPWIEKYRPNDINDVVVSDQIKNRLLQMISLKDAKDLLIDGPTGVGKTCTLKCFAKKMYGDYYDQMVLELVNHDDRGIKIHKTIDNFRRTFIQNIQNTLPYKMIIVDEIDNMTDKAKYVIAMFIENHHSTIRFIMSCNQKHNVPHVIQSRCIIINYLKGSPLQLHKKLSTIANIEGFLSPENDEGIKLISMLSCGDYRVAINMLQLTYSLYGLITEENVFKVYDKPRPVYASDLLHECYKHNLAPALKCVLKFKNNGYSGMDIMVSLISALKLQFCSDIDENKQMDFIRKISHCIYNISKGVDSDLQLCGCIAELCE